MDAADWAINELGDAALGDSRRTDRLVELATQLARQPDRSLPAACQDPAQLKAAYRFFSNPEVVPQAMLAAHVERTAERLRRVPLVLAVQDTTEVDYTSHRATTGLGVLNDAQHRGMLAHTTLAITPQRVPLGLLAQQVMVRDPAELGKRHRRKERPIEEKESHKWLLSLQAACAVAERCPQTRVVSVGDREGDVYELLTAPRPGNVEVLVRSSWDRALKAGKGEPRRLREAAAQGVVAGTLRVAVPARAAVGKRAAQAVRTAEVTVRWRRVKLRPPRRAAVPGVERERLAPVEVWVVWAHEEAPPAGVEGLDWLLLSTEEVESGEQALLRVEWYACRWGIEVFHKVLKSGCRIEARQLGTGAALERLLTLFSIIAWRVLWAAMLARAVPELPAGVLLEREEWEALYCTLHKTAVAPRQEPGLREVVRGIARLGGFLGRKGDGEPGVMTVWRGMARLVDLTEMYRIMRPAPAAGRSG